MVKALVRDIQPGDVEAVLANMREPDRMECEAMFGPQQEGIMLRRSVEVSTLKWALTFDGVTGAVFGVAPIGSLLSSDGAPWLIGTDLIDRYKGAFIKLNRPYIRQMLVAFPRLINMVDCRNTKSIAYLKKMGFSLIDPVPIGDNKIPFFPFFMEA